MDSRHESLKTGLLNQIIAAINLYIQTDTDTLVANDILRETIQKICSQIYAYLGVSVDTEEILSKKNLLSINTVFLPTVTDPEASKILNDQEFLKLMDMLGNGVKHLEGNLRENIQKILMSVNNS